MEGKFLAESVDWGSRTHQLLDSWLHYRHYTTCPQRFPQITHLHLKQCFSDLDICGLFLIS